MSIRTNTRNGHTSALEGIYILVAPNELGPSPCELVALAAHYGVPAEVKDNPGSKLHNGIYLRYSGPDGAPYFSTTTAADIAEIRAVLDGSKDSNAN